jgi:VanZ family protein
MKKILYYITRYPFSLLIILAVVYLSFFNPPSLGIPLFPYFDKLVHFCMYGGMSGMLWLEFLRNHRNGHCPLWHAWIGAVACPIAFSGLIELLQESLTTYRGGEWADFFINLLGVLTATLIAYYLIRPYMIKS